MNMNNKEVRNNYLGLMLNLIEQKPTTYITMKVSWDHGMMWDYIEVPEVANREGITKFYIEGIVWHDGK